MNIEIANRLYEYRKANGFSQEELAEKIGVSRQAISKWERSESSPDTDNLIALAKLYNVSLDEMINGESAPAKADAATAPPQDNVSLSGQGLDVQSKNGDSVDIGKDGVNVNAAAQPAQTYYQPVTQTETQTKKKAPWVSGVIWLGGLILFLLIGATFPRGWSVSWIIFLLLPAIDTGVDAIVQKNPHKFAYPLLACALFCALGMGFGLWHPAWILFLTIPVYYIILDSFKKTAPTAEKRSPVFIVFAVVFFLVACSTLGIVCHTALQGRNTHGSNLASVGKVFNYENEEDYKIGGATLAAQDIESLQIDWVSGSINIAPAAGDTVTFSETKMQDEDLVLRYLVDENGTLKIQFCKAHLSLKSLGDCHKDLTVSVPEKMFTKLQIDSVSADVALNGVDAAALEMDNVSGNITAKGCYNSLDVDNVSGNASIFNTAAHSEADVDTVSGDITLQLPKDIGGFSAKYDTVSGSVNVNNFNAATNAKSKTVLYGDADSVTVHFDSVSGDLNINAA